MPRPKKQRLKQRADGRYRCRYHGQDFYGATEAEALAAREEYKRQEQAGELRRRRCLFGDYALTWLAAYKSHLTAAPYNTHARNIERFIAVCEDRPLQDYTPTDISGFYQRFAKMSASTIHSVRDTVRGVFRAALADGLIDRDPTAAVPLPKGTKGTHRLLTDAEKELILCTAHRLRAAVIVMLYAGLRRGEVMALQVPRDVDFDRKTITVREAVRFDTNGKPILCDPKTEAGARVIPMLDVVARELRGISGLVCPSASGALMTESAWKRGWSSYLNALGVTDNGRARHRSDATWVPVTIRAHDLRHTYCTMLFEAGVDLKTAMLWMGHADQTMTMQIYTHLSDKRRTEAEIALRNAELQVFGGQNGGQIPSVEPKTIAAQGL